MARYYFDVHVGDHLTIDDDGLELSSQDKAWAEAARAVGELTRDQIPKDLVGQRILVEVRDPLGPVLTVRATCITEQLRSPVEASLRSNGLLAEECLRLLSAFSNANPQVRTEVLSLAEKYADEFPQFAQALQKLKRAH